MRAFPAMYRPQKFLRFHSTTALQRLQIDLQRTGVERVVGPLAWLDAPNQFPNYILFPGSPLSAVGALRTTRPTIYGLPPKNANMIPKPLANRKREFLAVEFLFTAPCRDGASAGGRDFAEGHGRLFTNDNCHNSSQFCIEKYGDTPHILSSKSAKKQAIICKYRPRVRGVSPQIPTNSPQIPGSVPTNSRRKKPGTGPKNCGDRPQKTVSR